MGAARKLALAGGAATVGAALWWRAHPSACPYSQRFWVEAPHPFITRERLREILDPRPGERLLEVGPGTGYYAVPVAGWIAPDGSLDLLDIQQEMLDHTMRRATERGFANVEPTLGNAESLPYEDHSFDAAVLTTVLGEIPDQEAAVLELKRVLKPGGRLVVGELFGDPHMVTLGSLQERAAAADFEFERVVGPNPLGYFARFGA
jgi:ubiquinone/menaquinone biosynthesis C-methylase UbiE